MDLPANLLELAKDTGLERLLGEIRNIMQSGSFTEVKQRFNLQEDIPAGEMTDFEKAAYTLLRQKVVTFGISSDDKTKLRVKADIGLTRLIMYNSIEERLTERPENKDVSGCGIREGFSVVLLKKPVPDTIRILSLSVQ